ncbi:MAG: Ig-like domain repeat protein [Proteobacteria bacterium]|nr:Ig-like domain repeat protein [Pseudomonadota bacterium]
MCTHHLAVAIRLFWLLLIALWLPTIQAAPSDTPIENAWVTNGTVSAIAVDNATGITYLGGDFTVVGFNTGKGVPIDASTGNPVASFPKVKGIVRAVAADGVGGWYIGGEFTSVGGVARNYLAHINADGTLDPVWNPNADGTVRALAVSGTTVYVGGSFSSIGGTTRNRLAAFDTSTGSLLAWNPDANFQVLALAVSGTTVYVGGEFTTVGGTVRNRLAALDSTTGSLLAWNPNADVLVRALAVSGTTVYVGGNFNTIGGTVRNRLAALDTSTGSLLPWNPNVDINVRALAVSGTTVYAGGQFTTMGGMARNRLAAIDASTGSLLAWNPNANGTTVSALAVSGTTVYAGGDFTNVGGTARNRLAALDANTGSLLAWNPNADYDVYALAVSGTTVYAGGFFTILGSTARNRLAALDANGDLLAWNPNANGVVQALAVSGNTVYAGGSFTTVGGTGRNRLAALDTSTGSLFAWNPNASSFVYALAVSGSTVYAGGDFTTIGGTARNRLAALDASTGSLLAWNPDASSTVRALAVSGSTVYAGGDFTTISSTARNRLAALNASTGSLLAWNPEANSTVRALAVSGATVYAGGDFSRISGIGRDQLAALDTSTGSLLAWIPGLRGLPASIYALAVSGSTIYAGGSFYSMNFTARNNLAALDASTGSLLSWNPNADGSVGALAVRGSTVSVGGSFSTIGGIPRPNLALFAPTTTPTTTSLSSSLNPAQFGQSVTLTAAVNPSAATGSVTFKDGGSDLGTTPLSNGSATYVNSALSAGSHSLTAVYAGDAVYSGSTSPVLTQTINKSNTTTGLLSSLNPSNVGDSVTFTATVTPAATGTVNFFDGASSLGSGTLNGSSQATVSTSALTAGSHSITGVYSGNAAYNTSTSSALTQTVNASAVAITVATNPAGLTITADGSDYTGPQTFNWIPGSSHTLATASPQAGAAGTRYPFANWSDGGAQSHSITVPASPTTYTANFGTEYQLTTSTGANGSVLPVSGNWYAAGSTPTISATANGGYAFDVWTLASGSGPIANLSSASTTVTMNGPNAVSASFKGQTTSLSAAVTGKSGTFNGLRTWFVTVSNSGNSTGSAARLDSFTISMSGRCQPTVVSSFPLSLGDISPGGSQTGMVSVDFSGCAKLAKFNASVGYSANVGSASGSTPLMGVGQ